MTDNHSLDARSNEFRPDLLVGKPLLVLPSQDVPSTTLPDGDESEMLYEQRQEAEAMFSPRSIFVCRKRLPSSEHIYRDRLFGAGRPRWLIPTEYKVGVALDRLVLADRRFLTQLREATPRGACLYGFSQTPEMQTIAGELGIPYYGNVQFARWAGTKLGLSEFAQEIGVATPHTFPLKAVADIPRGVAFLRHLGYTEVLVKLNNSIGGRGHKRSGIHLTDSIAYLPVGYLPREGAVMQGWISGSTSVSLAMFLDLDRTYHFIGTQVHKVDSRGAAIGASPLGAALLPTVIETGHKLGRGYVRHDAYGPHTMGMIVPPPAWAERFGFPIGLPSASTKTRVPEQQVSPAHGSRLFARDE
jgi:hypothetical protein